VVNEAVDERKHLTASTRAAARYLARNNGSLRNWLNALLSYNMGPAGVKPYTLPTDAGATEMAITEQTSPYVLMFLAQKIAFEPACGLNPKPPLRLQEFPAVPGQSLAVQAETIYADPLALATHNRWLLAPVVPADRPYTLIVPITDAAQAAGLAANQRIDSGKELITAPTVSAKNSREVRVNNLRALIALPSETKEELARRGGTKLGTFLRHNELRGFDQVVAGRPYYLESKRDAAAVEYHVVHSSESVADIAQKYGIRRKAILTKNRLSPNEELRPGRVLWLQHTRPREVAVEYRTEFEGLGLELPAGSPRPAARPATPPVALAKPKAGADSVPTPRPAVKAAAKPKDADGADIDAATEALNEPARVTKPLPTLATAPPEVPLPAPAPLPADPEPLAEEPVRTTAGGSAGRPVPAPATASSRPVEPVVSPASKPVALKPATVTTPAPVAPAVKVPAKAMPDEALNNLNEQHRVEPGETVYAVARRYKLRPADLLAWNNLPANAGLTVGQVLQLRPSATAATAPAAATPAPRRAAAGNPALYTPPVAKNSQPAAAATASQHTVVAGETLFSISRRYEVKVDDLQAWNNKPDKSVRVGEVLRVKEQ
jgi:membrane-bound lytic murein transglycosylase D